MKGAPFSTLESVLLLLELGVGYNTPGIIKYPFWRMTAQNKNATYVCINLEKSNCPEAIVHQSICMNADIGHVLESLKKQLNVRRIGDSCRR